MDDHAKKRFLLAFAAAQMYVGKAQQRDWLLEFNLKRADESLQEAFELLAEGDQREVLEVLAKMKMPAPAAPPKRQVGPRD